MTADPVLTGNEFVDGVHPAPDCQGYHPIALVADGELLCEHCVMDPTNPVQYRPNGDVDYWDSDAQWTVVAWTHSGDLDGEDHQCAHCYRDWN